MCYVYHKGNFTDVILFMGLNREIILDCVGEGLSSIITFAIKNKDFSLTMVRESQWNKRTRNVTDRKVNYIPVERRILYTIAGSQDWIFYLSLYV